MNRIGWLGVLVILLSAASLNAAEPDVERAKSSFKAGVTAYAAGDYLAAIQAFDVAYALTPLPQIAFSLAQAERKQFFVSREHAHLERAIELFRSYVEQVPRGGRRADALDALSQLEPLAALQTTAPPSEPKLEGVRRTRLMITSEAQGARVSVDGLSPTPSPCILEVDPGTHSVTVEAPGFYASQRDVIAVNGELVVAEVVLREQPSMLSVSAPPDAELYVDGVFASRGGDPARLELPSGPHRLVVAAKGRREVVKDLELERGQTRELRVSLERTAQRTTSLGLFIAGGAALGASLILSSFAIRAENDAEDFLGRQEHGNVTNDDLDQYDEAVESRNRFRTATAISAISSAGLFLSGVLLYYLDYPDPARFGRFAAPDTRPNSDTNGGLSRVLVTPTVQLGVGGEPRTLGGAVRAAF